MAKMITPEMREAEAQKIFKKVVTASKKITKYVFNEAIEKIDGRWVIELQSDLSESIVCLAEDIITKNPRAEWGGGNCYQGTFDWASDTYLKPGVLIYFKV